MRKTYTDSHKHVLVVAYYFPPMGLSGVQRIAKLVKYLPKHGWRVTVITPSVGAYFAFDYGLLEELNQVDGVNIVRTPSWDPTRLFKRGERLTVPFPEEKSRRFLSFLSQLLLIPDNKIGWKRFAVRAAKGVMKKDPFDAVFATAPPYTCFLAGLTISDELRIPLLIDYRDDWIANPRHSYPTGIHKRMAENLERKVVQKAEHVISINQAILDNIGSRVKSPSTMYHVVPQGYDPDDFGKIEEGDKSADIMEFVYTGMFYDAQQPDTFLKALARVFKLRPQLKKNIRARFVGLFPESKRGLITQLDLAENVILEGYVSHEDSIQFLKSCDVAWMIVGKQNGEELISTGKLFEYIGSGKPILGLVPNGEAQKAIEKYGAGVVVDPENSEEIVTQIGHLYDQWERGELPTPDVSFQQAFNRDFQAGIVAGFLDKL